MKRLFIDTETTGLDPNIHELLEVAIVVEEVPDPKGWENAIQTWGKETLSARWRGRFQSLCHAVLPTYRKRGVILSTWSQKVKPQHIERAEPRALEVNKYSEEEWERDGAVPFKDIAQDVYSTLSQKGVTVIGSNPKFDLEFLKRACKDAGIAVNDKFFPFRPIDTRALSFVAWGQNGRTNVGLDSLRTYLDLPTSGAHRALKDALDAREVFYAALESIRVL